MYVVYVNGCFLDVHYLGQYFVCMLMSIILSNILYVCCIWLFLRCIDVILSICKWLMFVCCCLDVHYLEAVFCMYVVYGLLPSLDSRFLRCPWY